jgi:hypothetical protein
MKLGMSGFWRARMWMLVNFENCDRARELNIFGAKILLECLVQTRTQPTRGSDSYMGVYRMGLSDCNPVFKWTKIT